jgi:hypothetical protein
MLPMEKINQAQELPRPAQDFSGATLQIIAAYRLQYSSSSRRDCVQLASWREASALCYTLA